LEKTGDYKIRLRCLKIRTHLFSNTGKLKEETFFLTIEIDHLFSNFIVTIC